MMSRRVTGRTLVRSSAIATVVIGFGAAGCISEPPPSPGPLPAELVGKTLLHHGATHGVQVEFYAADGYAYLWYPGNEIVVQSSYRENTETSEICFFYPNRVYNPGTGRHGGEETCQDAEAFWDGVQETAEGDPFGLATERDVPFVLPRERQTLEALKARAGI